MSSAVVAVVDWRSASALKENVRLLERAQAAGKVEPREWRSGSSGFRSLTIREDGSCQLQRWSVAAASRRCGGRIACRARVKARGGERG